MPPSARPSSILTGGLTAVTAGGFVLLTLVTGYFLVDLWRKDSNP